MTFEGLGEMFEGDSADTWLVQAMEMAGKHSDHYFRRWQAKIVTTIIFFVEKNGKKPKVLRTAWFGEKVVQKKFLKISNIVSLISPAWPWLVSENVTTNL